MHQLCKKLFPICRSITGNGVRKSLSILSDYLDSYDVFEVLTGTQCFDWTIPKEWNICDAYIITPSGKKICSFAESNLHVVGYSIPVNKEISFDELQQHLHSLPDQPDAIPYVTSYYRETWGFCISHNARKNLVQGTYKVVIDSTLEDGSLAYGEIVIPGESEKEIFLSTYLCHPSMANNELSGPVVTTFLAKWIKEFQKRRYTYRIIIIPETIGSIAYLSRNHEVMKENIVAGFNLTCVGDERDYSYLPSREEDTLADRAAKHVLGNIYPNYSTYSFLERGSDERQYCSPGIDLPVCSVMRSKYNLYPEYHTSLDDLSLVTPKGLYGAYAVYQKIILALEMNRKYRAVFPCEPQLGKRGLYPTTSTRNGALYVNNMVDFLAYACGENDLLQIAEKINVPAWELAPIISKLLEAKLIEDVSQR